MKPFDVICCSDDVGNVVRDLVRLFQLFERDQIKVHGFTTTQCYVLLEIMNQQEISMRTLSERMNLNTSTMTRVLDTLVRDGFIERIKSESDRRLVLVKLTETGKKSAVALNQSLADYYGKVALSLPEGKIDDVLESARLLIKAFESANPNCC